MFRPQSPSSALSPVVVRFGRLGDTLLLQPLLQRLHRRYGLPCRLLALGDWPEQLYIGQPDVGEVIALRDRHRPLLLSPERWRVVMALREMREAPFYICEPEPRALSKIRRLLALAGIDRGHCEFLNDMPAKPDEHWLDRLQRFSLKTPAALTDVYTAKSPDTIKAPQLQVSAAERADRDTWLRVCGIDGHPLVLLQSANKRTMRWNGVRESSDDDKSWPIERWAAVARAVLQAQPEARVLLCGAPAEAEYLQRIATLAAHKSVLVAAQDLPLTRLKATLEIAHSMISVDTGPAHIAAAVGCPLLVLFGAASPAHWLPRSASGSAVVALVGPAQRRRIDAIPLDAVIDAWRNLPSRDHVSSTAPLRSALRVRSG